MAEDRIDIDTKPAIEAINELQTAFDNAFERVQEGSIDATESLSTFEKATLQAKKRVNDLGDATGKAVGGGGGAAGAGLNALSKASKNSGREMGLLVNSVAEFGYTMGTAIPSMRNFGTQLAMMGGNAYSFGAAFGPIGVGVGVLMGAIPILIGLFSDTEETTEEVTDKFYEQAKAASDLEQSLYAAAQAQRELNAQLNEAVMRASNFQEATIAVRNIAEEVQRLEGERVAFLLPSLRMAVEAQNEAEAERWRQEIRRIEHEIAKKRELLALAQEQSAAFAATADQEAEEDANRQARSSRARRDDAERKRTAEIRAMVNQLAGEIEVETIEATVRAEIERARVLKEIEAEELQLHINRMNREAERREETLANMQLARDIQAQLQADADATMARMQQVQGELTNFASNAIELGQSVAAIRQQVAEGELTAAQGRKLAFAEFLKQFSREMLLRGLQALAEIPMSYPDVPKMAQRGVAAGLFFAAAGAAGAGGRKIASNVGQQQADRQEGGGGRAPRAEGGGGGGGGSVTFVINAPYATRAEAAVAMDEAQRAYGRQMRGSGGNRG